jgi:hypothetical protein
MSGDTFWPTPQLTHPTCSNDRVFRKYVWEALTADPPALTKEGYMVLRSRVGSETLFKNTNAHVTDPKLDAFLTNNPEKAKEFRDFASGLGFPDSVSNTFDNIVFVDPSELTTAEEKLFGKRITKDQALSFIEQYDQPFLWHKRSALAKDKRVKKTKRIHMMDKPVPVPYEPESDVEMADASENSPIAENPPRPLPAEPEIAPFVIDLNTWMNLARDLALHPDKGEDRPFPSGNASDPRWPQAAKKLARRNGLKADRVVRRMDFAFVTKEDQMLSLPMIQLGEEFVAVPVVLIKPIITFIKQCFEKKVYVGEVIPKVQAYLDAHEPVPSFPLAMFLKAVGLNKAVEQDKAVGPDSRYEVVKQPASARSCRTRR